MNDSLMSAISLSPIASLSLRWHLNRKTGEVLRVMDRGTQAISSLLSSICFNIAPVLVDITIAVIYLMLEQDVILGSIVLLTMSAYLTLTLIITEWFSKVRAFIFPRRRTKFRRKVIELDNATHQVTPCSTIFPLFPHSHSRHLDCVL